MLSRRIIPYDPRLKPLARRLRQQMTSSEVRLWQKIRRKQILGYSFYRQRPIDRYIVDFYCPELQLAIEVDGSSHDETTFTKDRSRQQRLETLGVRVIRFNHREVLRDLDNVLQAIEAKVRFLEGQR